MTAWIASVFTGPLREWLLDRHEEIVAERPGRTVGQSDIDALWAMCEAFPDADHRLGGGYARETLLHYLDNVVFPLLNAGYSDTVGRDLMAATARLCDICAFMNYDSGRQGSAQRYYIQALRLSEASGNRAIGTHILGDMSDQAYHLGNPTQARDLATAGYDAALESGALTTAARCVTAQGKAHALLGARRACDQACTTAEKLLDRAASRGERTLMYRMTAEDLTGERLWMVHDLGRPSDVQRHSTRTLKRVNTVRRDLASHANRPSVQEFEERFRAVAAAPTSA